MACAVGLIPSKRTVRSGAYACRVAGMTLVEMLVVFVLLGLVATLLFQATGYFASRYGALQRLHQEGAVAGLQQHWFTTTVQALVPYGREARRFRGTTEAFAGVTLQPLATESGVPTDARWSIDEQGGVQTVYYREERDGIEWPVFTATGLDLGFEYADATGGWHLRWPVEEWPTDWLPSMVRLADPERGVLWVARVDPSPPPLLTEQDFL